MAHQLGFIGSNLFAGSTSLKDIVLPSSIDSVSKIDSFAFANSNLTSVIFLGISSANATDIENKKMFNVGHDCWFVTSDKKRYKWVESAKTIIEDNTYTQLGKAKISAGKPNKIIFGKKIYHFSQDLYTWCTDPSTQDPKKFLSPAQCPMIIIYGDFKTSLISRKFLTNILENDAFYSWAKDTLKCYLFLVDRDGSNPVSTSPGSASFQFFKSIQPSDACKDFIVLNFIYKTTFITKTFYSGQFNEFKNILISGCDEAGFSSFDFAAFEVNFLEDPYTEVIPSSTPSVQDGYNPWWWTGSSITSIPDWT